jgi:hypothetical protein
MEPHDPWSSFFWGMMAFMFLGTAALAFESPRIGRYFRRHFLSPDWKSSLHLRN